MKGKEGLHLTDEFAAGATGIEHLIEEAKEGPPQAINALAAVGALVGWRQEARGQERTDQQFELGQTVLPEALDTAAQGGEALAPLGKEGGFHLHSNTTVLLDKPAKIARS